MAENTIIEIKDLSFSYKTKKGNYNIFKNLNLNVKQNEFICVVGPSGCGKTTLLKIIAGFEKQYSGIVKAFNEEITGISYRRGVVFQDDAVFPWMTVYKNIEYGLRSRRMPTKYIKEKVENYLKIVGLEKFKNNYPKELSTGMRKRVDVARVLANDPEIILMDEPFGALDAFTKETLQIKLVKIWENFKKTLVFITHDLEEALFLGDRIVLIPTNPNEPVKFYKVPFKRPRETLLKTHVKFQKMRNDIMKDFILES